MDEDGRKNRPTTNIEIGGRTMPSSVSSFSFSFSSFSSSSRVSAAVPPAATRCSCGAGRPAAMGVFRWDFLPA